MPKFYKSLLFNLQVTVVLVAQLLQFSKQWKILVLFVDTALLFDEKNTVWAKQRLDMCYLNLHRD